MDFSIVIKAGLTKTDFARLMRTSRTTVHNWFGGGGVHTLIVAKVRRTLRLLNDAVDAGDLPLPHDTPKKERAAKVVAVLKKHNAASTAD